MIPYGFTDDESEVQRDLMSRSRSQPVCGNTQNCLFVLLICFMGSISVYFPSLNPESISQGKGFMTLDQKFPTCPS